MKIVDNTKKNMTVELSEVSPGQIICFEGDTAPWLVTENFEEDNKGLLTTMVVSLSDGMVSSELSEQRVTILENAYLCIGEAPASPVKHLDIFGGNVDDRSDKGACSDCGNCANVCGAAEAVKTKKKKK